MSVPIEPTASSPFSAIGAIRMLQVFDGVAEGLLAGERVVVVETAGGGSARRGRSSSVIRFSSSHCRYGWRARDRGLDLLVGDDAALLRCRPGTCGRAAGGPCARTFSGGDVEHAGLGGHDDQAVLGDDVARRAQAVAVEHGADHRAVGEGDRRRAVPRLRSGTRGIRRRRASPSLMLSCFCHASGISIMTACGSERPVCTSSSSALSNVGRVAAAGLR